MDKCNKFDFNSLPDFNTPKTQDKLRIEYLQNELANKQGYIKYLEERILSLELDLKNANERVDTLSWQIVGDRQ